LLKSGGEAFVLTPNYNDILLKINFDAFAPFFFRKAHTIYLTVDGMKKIIENAGLKFIAPTYYHEFSLSNILYWLRDKEPRGNQVINGLDDSLDLYWKDFLVRTGQTNNIAVLFSKP